MISSYLFDQGDSKGFGDKFRCIRRVETQNSSFEVLEMMSLEGSQNLGMADELYYAAKQGIRPKFIRIRLNNGGVVVEPGMLYLKAGRIGSKTDLGGPGSKTGGIAAIVGNAVKSALTQESAVKPEYWGEGEIWLKPTFEHYLVLQISEAWGDIICDKGMFCACDMGVAVSAAANINSGALGGEGIWQTKLRGRGCILLKSPVPASEILVYKMHQDSVQINGNYVIARAGDIRFTLQRSMDTIAGTLVSGEGLLQTFEGTGMIFVASTLDVYESGLGKLSVPKE